MAIVHSVLRLAWMLRQWPKLLFSSQEARGLGTPKGSPRPPHGGSQRRRDRPTAAPNDLQLANPRKVLDAARRTSMLNAFVSITVLSRYKGVVLTNKPVSDSVAYTAKSAYGLKLEVVQYRSDQVSSSDDKVID